MGKSKISKMDNPKLRKLTIYVQFFDWPTW